MTRYHGEEEARKARDKYEATFEKKNVATADMVLPSIEVSVKTSSPADKATWLPHIMKNTGLAKSTGEAIRLIKQGGVKINDETVNDPDTMLHQGEHIVKVGKRKFYKVIITQ